MSQVNLKLVATLAIMAGSVGLGGCATKKYVREQIAPVSQRVDTLETRLVETDGVAKSALAEARAAGQQGQNNTQRLDQLNGRVDGLDQRLQIQEAKPAKRARN